MTVYESLGKLIEYLKKNKNLSDKTIKLYRLHLGDFNKYISAKYGIDFSVYDVTLMMICEYIQCVSEKPITCTSRYYEEGTIATLSPGSIQIYSNSLRGLYKWLEMYGDRPCLNRRLIPTVRVPKREIEFLEEEDLEMLISLPELVETRRDIALRNKLYILMLTVTGCRASEILGLKVSDIPYKDDQLQIKGKGDKVRGVFIVDRVRATLEEYLEEREKPFKNSLGILIYPKPSDYIFICLDGAHYGEKIVYNRMRLTFKKYAKHCNNPKLKPHILRASFATKLLRKGVRERYIQKLLGHDLITTTQRYLGVSNLDLKNAHKEAFGE